MKARRTSWKRIAEYWGQVEAVLVRSVWVTGVSGSGKSTAYRPPEVFGVSAIDADWEGINHWVDGRRERL